MTPERFEEIHAKNEKYDYESGGGEVSRVIGELLDYVARLEQRYDNVESALKYRIGRACEGCGLEQP